MIFQMKYESFSWNAEGLAKYARNDDFTARIANADIVCVQEALATDECLNALLVGFVAHAAPAVRTGGRPSGGLMSFFRTATFGAARLSQLPVTHPAFIASRVSPNDVDIGLVVINVYIPAHDGSSTPAIYEELTENLITLWTAFPADSFLVQGDLTLSVFVSSNSSSHSFRFTVFQLLALV